MNTPNIQTHAALQLTGLHIRQDAHGRYCLNDLHKAAVAAGANKRSTEPNRFFRARHTQELLAELKTESATPKWRSTSDTETTPNWRNDHDETITPNWRNAPVVKNVGGGTEDTGTFVCIELVIAYGQFVSAAFDLMVIRTFLDVVNRTHALPHVQNTKFWDRLRPHWAAIALLALQGQKNKQEAATLGRSAGSVGRCLARMYEVGYLNPVEVFKARLKPATAQRWAIEKPVAYEWGKPAAQQMNLFEGGRA
jgi:KilA-N domain